MISFKAHSLPSYAPWIERGVIINSQSVVESFCLTGKHAIRMETVFFFPSFSPSGRVCIKGDVVVHN